MKMNSIARKLLALCMTVLMLVSMAVPAFASELEGAQPPEGEGQQSIEQQIIPTQDTEPEHVHSHQAAVTTPASCTAEGVMTYTCACGDAYTAAIPVAEHTYGEASNVAPGCETEGSVSAACTVCGFVNTQVVPAAGHSYGEATTVAPTCEAEGSVSASCTVCGFVNTEVIPAAGHSYGEPVVVAATCTADGSKAYTCAVCGNVYTEVIPAAHTYAEAVVTPSTCTADGSWVYTCTVEGCGNVYTETIPAAHTYGEAVVVEPTCTAEGSRTYTCTVEGCGNVYTEIIPAAGHSYVDMVCSVCGAVQCSWQPDCIAAEHEEGCLKGTADKLSALLAQLPSAEEVTAENFESVKAIVSEIKAVDEMHRLAFRSTDYEMYVWDILQADANYVEIDDIISRGVLMLATNPVAKVGEEEYYNLQDAINAAASGGTVVLLDNVALEADANGYVKVSGTVTLDLAGKTISANYDYEYGTVYVASGGHLTIKDSSNPSSGRITSAYGIAVGVYGTLVVESGTFEGANDGGWSCALYNFYYDGSTYGKTTISGGSFNNIFNCGGLTVNGGNVDYLDNSGKTTIGENATVTEIVARNGESAPGLSGKGTIESAKPLTGTTIITDDSSKEVIYVDGKYTTVEADSVASSGIAKVNGLFYTTLKDAINAAQSGGTVEFIANVTTTEPVVISKNLSINGNNKTLTYTGTDRAITVENTTPGVNLSISDLTVNAPSAQRGINYNTTGKLTLNKVEVTAGTYAVNLPGSSNGAVVDIDDSKLSANIALNIWGSNANITVDNSALSCLDKTDVESYSAIQLNNDGTNIANGTTVTVTGGSISAEDDSSVVSNWTTTGVVNISSTTTVNGNPPAITVASINGAGFNTLQDAVKWHAEHNSTANIVLLRDVSLTENLVITRDVTIVPHSSNGYGLSSGGGKISVADNATLTIDGNYSKEQIAAFRQQLCAEGMCVYEGSIKVTKGHTGGTATCDAQAVCNRCQLPYGSTPDHTMKTAATCSTKAICDVCNKPYGELDPDNHALVYTGKDNTITETCANGCDHSATAKLELDSSVSTVYTGSEIKALKVTYSENWMAEKDLTVSYKDNIAIGKATGTIEKLNEDNSKATATAQFDITRATYSLTVNNYRYVRGSGYPLSFTSNVPYSADNTVTKLLIYRANGTPVMEVPAAHFVLSANSSGMTVITLSPTVMNALDSLNYELYASFTNGDAKGAFRVLLPLIFPMTGDDAQTLLLLCLTFVALGTAGVTLFVIRRKSKGNRYNGRH